MSDKWGKEWLEGEKKRGEQGEGGDFMFGNLTVCYLNNDQL